MSVRGFTPKHKANQYLLRQYVGINGGTVGSTTELKAIPRASQHAIIRIYGRFAFIHTIVTPFKCGVWSGEISPSKRPSETRTAFACRLHTCHGELPN